MVPFHRRPYKHLGGSTTKSILYIFLLDFWTFSSCDGDDNTGHFSIIYANMLMFGRIEVVVYMFSSYKIVFVNI